MAPLEPSTRPLSTPASPHQRSTQAPAHLLLEERLHPLHLLAHVRNHALALRSRRLGRRRAPRRVAAPPLRLRKPPLQLLYQRLLSLDLRPDEERGLGVCWCGGRARAVGTVGRRPKDVRPATQEHSACSGASPPEAVLLVGVAATQRPQILLRLIGRRARLGRLGLHGVGGMDCGRALVGTARAARALRKGGVACLPPTAPPPLCPAPTCASAAARLRVATCSLAESTIASLTLPGKSGSGHAGGQLREHGSLARACAPADRSAEHRSTKRRQHMRKLT